MSYGSPGKSPGVATIGLTAECGSCTCTTSLEAWKREMDAPSLKTIRVGYVRALVFLREVFFKKNLNVREKRGKDYPLHLNGSMKTSKCVWCIHIL